MTLQEAIRSRHSVRKYTGRPLDGATVEALQRKITEVNSASGLHVQLFCNEPKAFKGIFAYGKFSGVNDYMVIIGRKSERLGFTAGYYGQLLVLYAQTLGLNSCWVGLSYTKIPGTFQLGPDEKVVCYVALGYGVSQGSPHKIKTPAQVSNESELTPDWFSRGVEAALLAPTAINQQKFRFDYLPGVGGAKPRVKGSPGFSLVGYTKIDLGIAMCNFELAAGKENFDWDNYDFI